MAGRSEDWLKVDAPSFGERLRKIRERAGLTQRSLADFIGINNSALCRYESGERLPRVEHLIKIAMVLGVPSLDWLIFGETYIEAT